jgi:hypothetical protein
MAEKRTWITDWLKNANLSVHPLATSKSVFLNCARGYYSRYQRDHHHILLFLGGPLLELN